MAPDTIPGTAADAKAAVLRAEEPAAVPATANAPTLPHDETGWDGPTYYGRPQLKAAPFNNWVVGGYIALAGLSGGAALLSAVADVTRGREAEPTVRRGRYLSLLAPTLGSALLVWDLHTPKRFYNMLRVAKATSPMSIGTWLLMGFTASAGLTAGAQYLSDWMPWRRWPRGLARAAQVPAALTGAGLSTYTAALLASTSTPLWAAAPQALAVRFGSSSIAAGAAALSFRARRGDTRRSLDTVALAALTLELAAARSSHQTYRKRGVARALDGGWGQVERLGATGLGTVAPLALHAASLALARRPGALSNLASLAVMTGSLLLRVSVMAAGDESANRPEVSFQFSQPRNLPRV